MNSLTIENRDKRGQRRLKLVHFTKHPSEHRWKSKVKSVRSTTKKRREKIQQSWFRGLKSHFLRSKKGAWRFSISEIIIFPEDTSNEEGIVVILFRDGILYLIPSSFPFAFSYSIFHFWSLFSFTLHFVGKLPSLVLFEYSWFV